MSVPRLLVESTLLVEHGESVTDRHELITQIMLLQRQVAAVGNNINQIAHVANATGEIGVDLPAEVARLRALMRRISEVLETLAVPATPA